MGHLGLTLHILIGLLGFAALLLISGAWYQHTGMIRDARRFPAPGRLIDIGGARLHINIRGGTGGEDPPPVVFEAGIAATSLSWQLVQPEVAGLTQTASYDRAGLGWSNAWSSIWNDAARPQGDIWRVVEELRALLDSAGIVTPRILVGHSYGALVMTAYATRYPAEAAGLILVDPVAPSEWSDPSPSSLRLLRRGIRFSRRGALLARFGVPRLALNLLSRGARVLPKWIARTASGPGAGLIERMVGQVQKLPAGLWPMIQSHWCDPKSFDALACYLEALPESAAAVNQAVNGSALGDIPLIVLSSANASAAERAEHEKLARSSRQGRLETVPGSGHWIQLDRPDAVIYAIKEMVATCRS